MLSEYRLSNMSSYITLESFGRILISFRCLNKSIVECYLFVHPMFQNLDFDTPAHK